MIVGIDEEVEKKRKFHTPKVNETGPWYIINEESNLANLIDTILQLTRIVQMVNTPLSMTYESYKEKVICVELIMDFIWLLSIGIRFITTSGGNKTVKDIALNYLRGMFFIDVISVVPALVTMERVNAALFFKFLRLIRFAEMFTPFKRLMRFLMPWRTTFQINDT